MKGKVLVLALLAGLLILAGMAYSADVSKVMPKPENQKFITGDESLPNVPYVPSSPGAITQSPGDTTGYTQYDYQTNGSTGRRVVMDSQGGVHVAWMRAMPYPTPRQVYYNYKSPAGIWGWPGNGSAVSFRATGDGYTNITITPDDRAGIVFHNGGTVDSNYYAVDSFTGLGIFDYYRIPNRFGTRYVLWPYVTTDRQGNVHVVATQYDAAAGALTPVGYTRTENGGTTWTALAVVDTLKDISPVVISSPVSDKVATVYTHPYDTTSQWKNDIYYVQSLNGTDWDFRNGKINVTHYGGSDSLFAYTDCAAAYDYNDDLHIVWNAQYVTASGVYYNGRLLHFDITSGDITQIAQFDTTWLSSGCDFGVWNFVFAKMSISAQSNNNLFVAYTSWDTSDCSAGGFANGDIYMNYSTDGGATWSAKTNMTNSHTPGCEAGDCDSDHWSTLAEKVDSTTLHLFYVNDKDAGGIPQTEGSATDNPMLYLEYPNPTFVESVDEGGAVPRDFSLSQNYPNPFNARTLITFELKNSSNVELAVFDITGSRVATLVSGNMAAGSHQITWDAKDVSSGVYYYTLKSNGSEMTRKMTLLK